MHEKLVCWLYNKKDNDGNDGLGCRLCEKYRKITNSNGKINLWCTAGYQIMKLSKIKEHNNNEVHKEAQNDTAALEFLRHVASYLHEEIIEKVRQSPSIAWMLDESTSRSVEKSVIVYVRYFDEDEAKTSFYGIIGLDGDGVNNGVVAKLREEYDIDFVELNTCAAHSFALVGSHAGIDKQIKDQKIKKRDLISKLENTMGKIYQYFGSKLKFKRLFHIRWSSTRDSIKPIMFNITPTNQALFATLQETKFDKKLSKTDRETASDLMSSILDDEFLFMLHFNYDLHECVLGKTNLMVIVIFLFQFNNSYGAFQIVVGDRNKLFDECFTHIDRLLFEIEKRFKPSKVQECFLVLFEPDYLVKNKNEITKSYYGREELDYICKKYKRLNGFNMEKCHNEWENFKISLSEFVYVNQYQKSRRIFWKSFISWKEAIDHCFRSRFQNFLILLSIYLISPLNSAECERGYLIANKIQTNGRSQIMIETLDVLMNVRLLFPDDLRSTRCQEVIEKSYNTWNGNDENRRINRIKLLIDVPDDYTPSKQARLRPGKQKRPLSTTQQQLVQNKNKKTKTDALKCANRCGQRIAGGDSSEMHAIQCCYQNEFYDWIEYNCSRCPGQ
ncbi:unnamed protein product [Rotaria socialis]|uniref:DUF4371 domain-containing protein n=1 Tax=Rotaria socialis TaxID=392032 RepID=A0A820SRS8_9BILA|nr:unnamed protein product [Rotaria socialis]